MRKKSYKKSSKSNAARIKKQAAKTLSTISKLKKQRKAYVYDKDTNELKVVKGVKTSGIYSKDITFFNQNRDALRKLVKANNQKIERLAKKGLLDQSAAYKSIHPFFLTEDGKLTGYTRGKSNEYVRALIEAHLKFATSDTTTLKGINKVRNDRQNNFINKIVEYSHLSASDRKTIERYLKSLPNDEFDNIIGTYTYLLSKQLSYSSGERFLAISQDIAQKARRIHEADSLTIVQQIKSNILREDLKKREEYALLDLDMLGDEELRKLSQPTQDLIDATRETPLEKKQKRAKHKATFTDEDLRKLFS